MPIEPQRIEKVIGDLDEVVCPDDFDLIVKERRRDLPRVVQRTPLIYIFLNTVLDDVQPLSQLRITPVFRTPG